jgi:glycine/D-amino acid oxidase-like deaminating enzyme
MALSARSGPASLPRSLWAATGGRAPDTPPLEGERSCEVAVVGGGYTGLSAALHLAEAGAQVTLLEAVEPGWGASGRNGGQVIPGLKFDPDELEQRFGRRRGAELVAFAGGAADFTFALIERLGIACDARQCGWIQAAHGEAALRVTARRAEQWRARGAEVDILDAAAIEKETGSRLYRGGWIDRRGGQLHPLRYARGLAAAAQRAGAVLHGGSPVTGWKREGRGWLLETPGGKLRASQLLLCINAYGDLVPRFWPSLARSVLPVYSYQVATQSLSGNLDATILPSGRPVSDTRRLLAYCRRDGEGRLIAGGRGRFRDSSDPRDFGALSRLLREVFPQAAEAPLEYRWAGRVALTLDHLPHLHEPEPGLLAALGYNGRGVALASAMGHLLAQRVGGRAAETLPLPILPLRSVPLYALRKPAIAALSVWKRAQDRREAGHPKRP